MSGVHGESFLRVTPLQDMLTIIKVFLLFILCAYCYGDRSSTRFATFASLEGTLDTLLYISVPTNHSECNGCLYRDGIFLTGPSFAHAVHTQSRSFGFSPVMASTMDQHRARFRVSTNHPSPRDYTRIEVTYYQLKRLAPSPSPKPSLVSLPHDPYTLINVAKPARRLPHPSVSARHHGDSHGNTFPATHRRVHFADEPTVINYTPDAPHARGASPELPPPPPPPKPKLSRSAAPTPAPFAAPPATSRPSHARPRATRSDAGTSRLHDYLVSFPDHLWDVRRHSSPSFDPQYAPRFCEPVFPAARAGSRRPIRLAFTPCYGRPELSWFATVTPGPQNYLVVGDVLRAISVELYGRRRSVCRDPGAGHSCFARAPVGRELRASRLCTGTPGCHDRRRNVDLFQGGRGCDSLWFRGLEEQTLSDGEVVYRVVLS